MPAKPPNESILDESSVPARLLLWYDTNARVLPWRMPPGGGPGDPYRTWLSEVMLQQTTVATVAPRFTAWIARWPDFASLAAADDADVMAAWAGLGYYARARNLLAAARLIAVQGVPGDEAGWRALPGVGDYTAAAVAAIALGQRAVVVDGNVERVVARLFTIREPLPGGKATIRAATDAITPRQRAGDFAQAMMDLGATVCTPRKPRCTGCPLSDLCLGFASGTPALYPVKAAKTSRPRRHGTVFWIERPGTAGDDERSVWLVRRPTRGLLGGMRALPTGPWSDASAPGLAGAPVDIAWRLLGRTVSHVFSHFELELTLAVGTGAPHDEGEWWPVAALGEAGLPTLFAKCAAAILKERA